MKVVSMRANGSYFVNVLDRPEFQEYCKNMIKESLHNAKLSSSYGFGHNGIRFGSNVDFTQYCNFKKIPLKELPKVVNSIKTLIRSEIQEYIKEANIDLGAYTNINVELIDGVQCGMATKKYKNGNVVRDYQQQWEEVNAELYCGKRYTEKQFTTLKERKSQIYRKRQVMWMKISITFSREGK